jgi:hypothetical protein
MQGQIGAACAQPPCGTVRDCTPYADELARMRVITADGFDYVVATAPDARAGAGWLTSAYPVSQGYLVLMRQPLCELHSESPAQARLVHLQLTEALAHAGVRLVRARHTLAARRRAERVEAERAEALGTDGADWLSDPRLFHTPAQAGADTESPFSASVR